ncbi:MAG: GAF domain-containing protein [Gloeocapsa sp. UFS-A4-WI-NPMV-4B04]|jgi:twitching motility protein PilJ|nr:GAF domain-containing protein [Gloeocapsa sp. UFS-A4-WI-NPMV-4B04]
MTPPAFDEPHNGKASPSSEPDTNQATNNTPLVNIKKPTKISSSSTSVNLSTQKQDAALTADSSQTASLQESPRPWHQRHEKWSLKTKATVWAIALSMLPVLAVGTSYYLENRSISSQITQVKTGATSLEQAEVTLQKQLSTLLFKTGATAILTGALAAFLANRAIRPILAATKASNTIVNKLRREEVSNSDRSTGQDELITLNTNIGLIEEQLPTLLWKQEATAERFQVLMNLTRKIYKSLSEEDVLRTTVAEVRNAFRTDRVVIFRFDSNGNGTFVEESVSPGLPKTLWATIQDPYIEEGNLEQYHNRRVRAIDNIYQAGLTDYQIGLLERFAIKASLVAPLIKDEQLFGLLIAHQCSSPRVWEQAEIALFAQVATQAGFALEYAKLLERVDARVDQAQTFINITRRIRESLNEEDVLRTTVEEIRKTIAADRVIVFGFDNNWYGTVIAESVLPGFPKALQANIKDPCFAEGYVEQYQAGRVQATNNIYQAGLTDCYLGQLEPFAVKANLVAPILKDGHLFGLLIAHQCSAPRDWQQFEIDLFTQLATQVGFALDHARLLKRIDAEGVQTQRFLNITRRIRESLNEEDVLRTTVEEIRKTIAADRVIVFGFDNNWYGTVIAESVLPGFPKALQANIKDPCFAEGYVEQYQAGRVQATNNIYQAGLTDCYLGQLEPFAVKANLVAPILKDGHLFGLLIAHQCSAPRDWQQFEIDLFAQLATQVGFALDHARLLNQVDQAYQTAEAASYEQNRQKEALQRQVSEMLRDSKATIDTLSNEALRQMESVKAAYDQIQKVADSAQEMLVSGQQVEIQEQQLSRTLQDGHESISKSLDCIYTVQETVVEATDKIKHLDQPSQKLLQLVSIVSKVVSQLKLQAMNATLEVARTGEAGEKFAPIAEKVLFLARQLDTDMAKIKLLAAEFQTATTEVGAAMQTGTEQVLSGTQLIKLTQEKLNQMTTVVAQMNTLVEELNQTANGQAEISNSGIQSVLEVASIASQTSELSVAVAESLAKLAAAQ